MNQATDFNFVQPGQSVHFSRMVAERDIDAFARLTGDFSPNHTDEGYMKQSTYQKRIVHGALLVGYMSTASSMIIEQYASTPGFTPVSLGYDRIRFIHPVFIGDTIEVKYEVQEIDSESRRSLSKIEIKNQHGKLVTVAMHILKWVPNPAA